MELVQELVKRGYRVIRFDNYDVGLSTHFTSAGPPDQAAIGQALTEGKPAPLPYTLQDMARDAVGLLNALDVEHAHIAGISMGGNIGQYIAIDFPERTLSLTTMMADSGNPELPVIADPKAFEGVPMPPPAGDKDAFVEWQVKTWQALSGSGYPTDEATLRAWAERYYERGYDPEGLARQQAVTLVDHLDSTRYRLNHLNTIVAPTVVLQGADDPLQPVASAQDLAARIPGAELRIVPGLGHDIPEELVPDFVDAITAAAARAAAGARATAPSPSRDNLANTGWRLVSLGTGADEVPVLLNATVTLEFGADGAISGQGGCNAYSGAYTVQDGKLSFREIVSTLRACVDQMVTEQEQRYLEALSSAEQYTLEGDTLTISSGGSTESLKFERTATPVATAPERLEIGPDFTTLRREGTLPGGEAVKQYVLAGAAGQTMTVDVTSDEVMLSMTITTPDGMKRIPEAFPADGSGYRVGHEFTLDQTGDYLVTLSKSDQTPSTHFSAEFTLQMKARPASTPKPTVTPERVEFEPGATSARLNSLLPSGPGVKQYVLAAAAGQAMTVDVTSDGVPLSLTIAGPSGMTWIPEMRTTANGYAVGLQFILPDTGDYVVTLTKADHTPSTSYTAQFTIQ
jgi:pimeloyl-ACP methyl ester carboxylesterase/heat shock protein HslJ